MQRTHSPPTLDGELMRTANVSKKLDGSKPSRAQFAGRRRTINPKLAIPMNRGRLGRGPFPLLSEVTTAQLEEVVGEILGGVTPYVAAAVVLGVDGRTHYRWMDRGRQTDAPDYYRHYFDEIHRAEMRMRGGLEKQVYNRSPEFYLTRSPIGRTSKDEPGWTEEQKHSVDVSVEFELVYGELGPKSQPVERPVIDVTPPPQLEEGDDDAR